MVFVASVFVYYIELDQRHLRTSDVVVDHYTTAWRHG
jgi:hypothetical protein